jgi:hypothetical protein
MESFIPWWYHNYLKQNSLPVAVVNFGMSDKMLKWCKNIGEVVSVPVSSAHFIKRKPGIEDLAREVGDDMRSICAAFYSKPFGLLQSPFQKTLWIDLDCLVLDNIETAFEFIREPYGMAMGVEEDRGQPKTLGRFKLLVPDAVNYSTGVIAYRHKAELIQRWAKEIIEREGDFFGDQDIFCSLVRNLKIKIPLLPKRFNWIVGVYGIDRKAAILHFSGSWKHLCYQLVQDFYRPIDGKI